MPLPLLADSPGLDFQPGDHICAFYNGGGNHLDDIVVDFVSKGLRSGKDDMLQFFTEEEGYLPKGHFSTDAFMRGMEATAKGTLSQGYERLWLIGDTTVVIRNSVGLIPGSSSMD